MKEMLEKTLREALNPLHLEVINESQMHSVPEGSESHFKLVVVSDRFEGETLLARHRLVNSLLKTAFAEGLHALALHTMTPDEWYQKGGRSPESPECMGGSKGG